MPGPEDILRDAVLKTLIMNMQDAVLSKKSDTIVSEILEKLRRSYTKIIKQSKATEAEAAIVTKVLNTREATTRQEKVTVLHLWARTLMPVRFYSYFGNYPAHYKQCIIRFIDPVYEDESPDFGNALLTNHVHNWYNEKFGPLCVVNNPHESSSEESESEATPAEAAPVKKAATKKAAKKATTKPAARAVGKKATASEALGKDTKTAKRPKVAPLPKAAVTAPKKTTTAKPAKTATKDATPFVEEVAPDTPATPSAPIVVEFDEAVPEVSDAVEIVETVETVESPAAAAAAAEEVEAGLAATRLLVKQINRYFRRSTTQVSSVQALSEELDAAHDEVMKAAQMLHDQQDVFLDTQIGSIYVV